MKKQAAHPNSIPLWRHQFSLYHTAARKLLALSLVQQCSSTGVIHPDLSFLCNFSEHLGPYFLEKQTKIWKLPKTCQNREIVRAESASSHLFGAVPHLWAILLSEFVGMVIVGRLLWSPRNNLLNLVPHRSSRSLMNFSLLSFGRATGLSQEQEH